MLILEHTLLFSKEQDILNCASLHQLLVEIDVISCLPGLHSYRITGVITLTMILYLENSNIQLVLCLTEMHIVNLQTVSCSVVKKKG